jgi:hypothetical protein
MFLSIGSLLASNLDYFGKYDEAETLYQELLLCDPEGDYICDYAIFLHKRKKDFDKAQRSHLGNSNLKTMTLKPLFSAHIS